MLRKVIFGIFVFLFCASQAFAFGLTADQMYRNLLKSEDKTNTTGSYQRKEEQEPLLAFKRVEPKAEAVWQNSTSSNKKKIAEEKAMFNSELNWNDLVVSVKKGNISPFELAEIRRLSERENAAAIELLAWMYATGTGLRQDLQKSYTYYLQAAHMGIPSAYDNVRAVYQAMTPAQRSQLPTF